jgi:hypothetical protein
MIRCLHLVLLLAIAPVCAAQSDGLANERRLATLEDQHVNQNNYNTEFDKTINDKIDVNQRIVQEHFANMERLQAAQDLEIQSLRDTQNIALFLGSLTPLALGLFYFWKGKSDAVRSKAIQAQELRIKALEELNSNPFRPGRHPHPHPQEVA